MSSRLMLSLVLSYVNMALCLPPYPVYSADAGSESSSHPGSLGEGEKRAWYLLFAHALNYLTFHSFLISPGTCTSVLCDVTNQLAAL